MLILTSLDNFSLEEADKTLLPSFVRFFPNCVNNSVVKVKESSEWKNISKSQDLRLFMLLKTALELAVEVGNKV